MAEQSPLYEVAARAGAEFVESGGWLVPAHYGDPVAEYRAACEGAALFDLSGRGLVELAGKEAVTFLNNLCTNDVKNLPVGGGCEAFLTTVKARVVAHFFVNRLRRGEQDVLWLDMVPGLADKVLKQLDHYLISERVELADRTAEFVQMRLCGSKAADIYRSIPSQPVPDLAELSSSPLAGESDSGLIRRHDEPGRPGYDIIANRSRAAELWRHLTAAGATPAGLEAYEVLRVEAGMPAYGPDINEDRLVMEVGRTRQAICYTKGCFLGQEPIVMARDRGHVNRTLLGLQILEGGVVPAGAKVFRDGHEVGQVASSVRSSAVGPPIALAYLRLGSQQPGTAVEVEVESGRRRAQVSELPFIRR